MTKETLFLETDKDLSNIGRIEIKGKDNLGLEFYVDKDTYWHKVAEDGLPTEDGWYLCVDNERMFNTIFHFHNGEFYCWNYIYNCAAKLSSTEVVVAYHKIPPYEEKVNE